MREFAFLYWVSLSLSLENDWEMAYFFPLSFHFPNNGKTFNFSLLTSEEVEETIFFSFHFPDTWTNLFLLFSLFFLPFFFQKWQNHFPSNTALSCSKDYEDSKTASWKIDPLPWWEVSGPMDQTNSTWESFLNLKKKTSKFHFHCEG